MAAAASTTTSPNVLIVTVDCLRRDRLSAYGYHRRTTPFLDSLLDRSLHATSAHSTSSWTTPAVASMLTGLYPHHHGAGVIDADPANLDLDHLPSQVGEGVVGLPGLLPGYAALAMSAIRMSEAGSLGGEGMFPNVDGMPLERGHRLVSRASSWIGEQDGPFLCWLHLGDVHDPLDVPREARVFGPVERYRKARRWAYAKRTDDVESAAFRRYLADRTSLYDAAVRSADAAIADLWSRIEPDVRGRTILVVSADHGEELWEHREDERSDFADPRGVAGVGHGHNLWQEILLVPLIFHGAGIEPGVVSENASLVDMAPTILDALGGTTPAELDGGSLLSGVPADRVLIAEGIAYGHQKTAVIRGDEKLLSSPEDGYERCFTLDEERRESPAGPVADAEALRAQIPAPWTAGPQRPMSQSGEEAMRDHLRDLGYIE